jgi:hypothetical protein
MNTFKLRMLAAIVSLSMVPATGSSILADLVGHGSSMAWSTRWAATTAAR